MAKNKLFKIRRFLCPGGCGRMIWKGHAKGVISYQMTQNLCRKCAKKERFRKAKIVARENKAKKKLFR